ncbi:MAG: YybH family protein [Candidatus Acidiferrales bacterium]
MKTAILFVALAFASAACAQQAPAQQAAVQQQIRDLEQKSNAAYAANDLPLYFSFYAADFTQWLPSGRTNLEEYKKMWSGFIGGGGRVLQDDISDLQIQVGPSGDTAIASYLLHVKTQSAKGKVSDEHFQETDVFFKRDGSWKIVHLHYSPAREKKS